MRELRQTARETEEPSAIIRERFAGEAGKPGALGGSRDALRPSAELHLPGGAHPHTIARADWFSR